MAQSDTSELLIRCLLLPLRGMKLLVPNTCVAEVAPYEAPVPTPHAPAWMQGMLLWRGSSVPLVSYEGLLGSGEGVRSSQARIAVFNSFGGHAALPFFALELQGIPRLLQATEESMTRREQEHADLAPVQCRVVVEGDEAIIPDLDIIEGMLLQLGLGGSRR